MARLPEFSFDDFLADPLVQLVMKTDKVDAGDIGALYARADCHSKGQIPADQPNDTSMAIYPDQSDCFRSGVGIALLIQENKIFMGQRLNLKAHGKCPQDGIEEGEPPPLEPLFGELRKEVGSDRVHFFGGSTAWLRHFV